jgi:hypothetical protein
VLKRKWDSDPWSEFEARAVYLAMQWQQTDKVYAELARTFQREELRPKLRGRFDRFAILSEWNYADPVQLHQPRDSICSGRWNRGVFAQRPQSSFVMSEAEREFYNELNVYLMDGFALAKQQGNKGRALGFVMTIFQKIAASSFAAVHRTLRRRLIALTVQEGLLHDARLDIDARDAAFAEARALIRHEFNLGDDRLAAVEADRILADMRCSSCSKIWTAFHWKTTNRFPISAKACRTLCASSAPRSKKTGNTSQRLMVTYSP